MAESDGQPLELNPLAGIRIGCASAGFLGTDRNDFAMFAFAAPAPSAVMFTTNEFCAAPVIVARRNLRRSGGLCRAWIINSGNANCGTGAQGELAAEDSCKAAAAALGCTPEQVLPFSTGVIMETIDGEKLRRGVAAAADTEAGWTDAAAAIMTTDTRPKSASGTSPCGRFTVNAIAKGAGMIHPRMATMLAFLVTDAPGEPEQLAEILKPAVNKTFNCISVDGDTSTNDAVALAATGGEKRLTEEEAESLAKAVLGVCRDLAAAILADGEGCNRLASVTVSGFGSDEACRRIAESVACSPLVKTMLAAGDPNLGRLLMAIGKAGVPLQTAALTISIGRKRAFQNSCRVANFSEQQAKEAFGQKQVEIEIAGGGKDGNYCCRFASLTAEYVRINSDYRS